MTTQQPQDDPTRTHAWGTLASLAAGLAGTTIRDLVDDDGGRSTALLAQAEPSITVLCTLKDAVKLVPLWPRAGAALWYVSQTVVVEQGAEVLEQAVARVLSARGATVPTAG